MTVLRDLAEPVLIARLTPRPPMTEDYYRDGERIVGWRTWAMAMASRGTSPTSPTVRRRSPRPAPPAHREPDFDAGEDVNAAESGVCMGMNEVRAEKTELLCSSQLCTEAIV